MGEAGLQGEQGPKGDPGSVDMSQVIQNSTTEQDASFNISGDGIVGGSLGIGTSTPEYALDVNGSVRIAGIAPFIKGGNNGTASCDTFCQDPTQAWGASGVCLGGGKIIDGQLTGRYIGCSQIATEVTGGLTHVACICGALP